MKLISALLLVLTAVGCCGQQQPVPLTATPNRPTATNTAETTQFGVLEIEFGISAAVRQQSLQGLLKFGLLRDLELDWAGNPWQHDAPLQYAGVSDKTPDFAGASSTRRSGSRRSPCNIPPSSPQPGRSKARARWTTL